MAAKGIDAKGYYCDVTDEAQVQEMVAKIEQELGTIDILVNNAGIIKRIPMTEMSVEDFRQVVDIDLNATFITAKAVIRLSGGGLSAGIYGYVPDYVNPPKGCRFCPRCPYAKKICETEKPPMTEIAPDHTVACFRFGGEEQEKGGEA